ncbi:TPA: hypothetical protein MYQ36_005166 [Citrobacter braakii]|uniref:hypothetical protein n=1 Tax=Enterobacteriaceae TaxID=543 RepID=UPI00064A8A7B|nr:MULTISPECIES: hypothetical protein [Enterobacteriaceae]ELH1432761.1 hypothetical protein [Raoultella ornithinolytica]MDU4424010.1 hypothetical protein [Raoultella sp.]HCB1596572.1 hypothetical protein [Citrobacter farmeri]HDZ1001106.1 hypothetical protein [Klebsiella variicola]AKL34435.1 hypothetical protein AB185_11240 [Klebsiella oxytoca]
MKKSEVVYDFEQIIYRLDALKSASCLKASQVEIDEIKKSIDILKNKISLGIMFSITGRENPTLPKSVCRFCGK